MSQDRKITPTSRELTNSKSPHAPVPDHHHPISPYEHLLRGVSGVDLYRGHIPLPFDPAAIPRGIQLEAGTSAGGTVWYFPSYAPKGLCGFTPASFSLPAAAYYLPRHLAPSPTYPHLYPPYLIRGYPDTAAMENRQTIINDYITSQQMHHNAAATAMAQRADMLRGLSPREPSLALNYAAGPASTALSRALGAGWEEQAGSHTLGHTPAARRCPDSPLASLCRHHRPVPSATPACPRAPHPWHLCHHHGPHHLHPWTPPDLRQPAQQLPALPR